MLKQRANILHISDLHYHGKQSQDDLVVVAAFLKDVESLAATELKPDIVIFSGDLVQNGDDCSSYYSVLDKVISPILHLTGLDENRVILTPGNHDVQRSAVLENDVIQNGLETTLSGRDELNGFYFANPNFEYIRRKFENFLTLKQCLNNAYLIDSDLFFDAYYIRELGVAIACVNTAWMSRGGILGHDDRARLLVPEAAMRAALAHLPKTDSRVLVGHHPLNWLAPHGSDDIRRILERNFFLYLHGHLHEPISASISSTIGRAVVHQSGALYSGRERYNGYAVIAINPEQGYAEVNLRSFYKKREKFDVATDIVENGRWYSSEQAQAFWSEVQPTLDVSEILRWIQDRVQPALQEELDEGFSDRPVSEIFVPPKLTLHSPDSFISEEERLGKDADECSLSELIQGEQNYIIVGKPEFGKTTLLRQISLGLLRFSSEAKRPMVPCLIEFPKIRIGSGRFEKLLRNQLPSSEGYKIRFQDLVNEGHLVILIDDVVLRDTSRCAVVREFIQAYPRCRFVLTINTELFDEFGVAPTLDTAVPFTNIYMEPFTRRQMRKLVERWDTKGTLDKEAVLDRLVNDIVHINIPLTAVNGTILLTIFEVHNDFAPINKAVLIETFIETLLNKHSIQEAKRARFDFRNKVDLLSYLAAEMSKRDQYRLTYAETIEVAHRYFRSIGLPDRSRIEIDNFIAAKVLMEKDDEIMFRYRAFLEYFIAVRMSEQEEFRSWVLEEPRYLSFANEIEYYAGIKRNDYDLLETVGQRFARLSEAFESQTGWIKDLSLIDEIQPPHDALEAEFFERIARQLQAPQLTAEQRDELLEAELPKDIGERQEVFRPAYDNVGEEWTWCLFLYSMVLRNTELVPDFRKRAHLSEVLRGWAQVTYHAILLIPALVKHRKMLVNQVMYHVVFPEDMAEGEVARGLYLAIPRALSDMTKFYVGTEKLEVQLREPSLDEGGEPRILKFYRGSLNGDLKLPGFLDALKRVGDELRPSRYLFEAFIWKLRQMLVRLPLSRQEDAEFRKLLAGAVGRLYPSSPAERQERTSREMKRLEHARLVREIQVRVRERGESERAKHPKL